MRKLWQDITVFDLLNGEYKAKLPLYYQKGHRPGLTKPETELLISYAATPCSAYYHANREGLVAEFCFGAVAKSMNARDAMLRMKQIGKQQEYKSLWDAFVYKALVSGSRAPVSKGLPHEETARMRAGHPMFCRPVLVTYQAYRTGLMDDDNNDASRKVVIDALVHNGVLANDDHASCRSVSLPWIYVPHKVDQHTRVRIEHLVNHPRFEVSQKETSR